MTPGDAFGHDAHAEILDVTGAPSRAFIADHWAIICYKNLVTNYCNLAELCYIEIVGLTLDPLDDV